MRVKKWISQLLPGDSTALAEISWWLILFLTKNPTNQPTTSNDQRMRTGWMRKIFDNTMIHNEYLKTISALRTRCIEFVRGWTTRRFTTTITTRWLRWWCITDCSDSQPGLLSAQRSRCIHTPRITHILSGDSDPGCESEQYWTKRMQELKGCRSCASVTTRKI
jgi:hypothetical protein